MPKLYKQFGKYIITENLKERTISIYTEDGKFLSTVNEGELLSELRELEAEGID